MNSPNPNLNPNLNPNDLARTLSRLGFRCLSSELDDFLARAIKGRWDPRTLLEQMARMEEAEKARRSLERRLRTARIGRFKPMADFDWNWPRKIDRPLIETALSLDFIPEGRNLVLLGANGLGKTMITKNIAHAAVLAGFSVLFRTASDLLDDLQSDSALRLRRKLKKYARPTLLCIDEIGYLPLSQNEASLFFRLAVRGYEHASLIITSNKSSLDWGMIFNDHVLATAILDRLLHYSTTLNIKGESYDLKKKRKVG